MAIIMQYTKGGHIKVDTKHVGKIRIRIKEVEKLVDIIKKL